jgi:hypothetical protein
MSVNPLEVPEESDKCVICLENLATETQYELPECSHKFHQNCIVQWFRGGNCKCPLCNNLGVNEVAVHATNPSSMWWRGGNYKYQMIRKYSRKKEAPRELKKEIEKIKKLEAKQKTLRAEIKEFKDKPGTWRVLNKEMSKLRRSRWRMESNLRRRKMAISNFNIVPIIIAKKVIV